LRFPEDVLLLDRYVPLPHSIVNFELGSGIVRLEEQLLAARRSSDRGDTDGDHEAPGRTTTDSKEHGGPDFVHEPPPSITPVTGTANSSRYGEVDRGSVTSTRTRIFGGSSPRPSISEVFTGRSIA